MIKILKEKKNVVLCKTYMSRQGGGMEYYNDNGFVVELLLRKV